MSKKIVYLFGAGATQAVIKSFAPGKSLMTEDIIQRILDKYSSKKKLTNKIWNELITNKDIEHLISVLESQQYISDSNIIRTYYRNSLLELAKPISKNIPEKNLYSVLIDIHKNLKNDIDEELLCLITLNYEDFLEKTIYKYNKLRPNYIFSSQNNSSADLINIIKLHGSFTWVNGRPIKIKSLFAKASFDPLWIPPGVDKKRENYPFNLLWGKALEFIMTCDVLRVVGCSLSRNDWSLVPILYSIQQFEKHAPSFEIEIIDYPSTSYRIKKDYNYLKVKSILEIPIMIDFFKKQIGNNNTAEVIKELDAKYESKDKSNPFYDWLESKIGKLIEDKKDISAAKIANNFYYKI